MKSAEARDVGRVAGVVLGRGTRLVRDVHGAISGTVHSVVRAGVGPVAEPVLVAQEVVTRSVYAVTGLGLSVASRTVGFVAESRMRATDPARRSLHDGPSAHSALAVGLGLIGDRAPLHSASLAQPMHVRRRGHAVALTRDGIEASYGEVSPQIAVFVHGLFETEHAWRLGTPERLSYAARLRDELDLTPVMLRYNTGLRVADNGLALGELLANLIAAWPIPLTRIVLVGHSMGGLVIHSALAQASPVGDGEWLPLVTDTVTLGSPHTGSSIARGVSRAADLLARAERTRFAAEVLDERSLGVRDLDAGDLLAGGGARPGRRDGIRHRAVVGVAGDRLPARVADALGDLVVPVTSAAGDLDEVVVVRGANHLGLLNDPEVHEHLVRWFGSAEVSRP